jgi:hypothetical protein
MICRYCGCEFEPKKRGRKNGGFCCKKCADNWRKRNVYDLMPKRYTKTCEYCGSEYTTNRENQKYCSVKCRGLAHRTGRTVYDKTCLYCGTPFQTIDPKHKYCTSACAARHAGDQRRGRYFCEYCGKPRYSDHPNRNRFCSRACADKARMLKSLPDQLEKEQQYENAHRKVCPKCGKEFQTNTLQRIYCSAECMYNARLKVLRDEYAEAYQPRSFVCSECGKPVTTVLGDTHKVYCSTACAKRAENREHRRVRKEQMQRAFVEPVGLKTTYRTHQGWCAICGLPVPPTTESSNQWAATVDHITPLSKGGLHKKSNCQLAHRLCNSLKQDTEDDFRIDWAEKLKSEPGRWNEQLDDLWNQLGMDKSAVEEAPAPARCG